MQDHHSEGAYPRTPPPPELTIATPPLTLTLAGPAVADGRIVLADLVHLGQHVQSAIDRIALVLSGAESSRRPGRRPRSVQEVKLVVVNRRPGSVVLDLDLARDQLELDGVGLGERSLEQLVAGIDKLGDPSDHLPEGWDAGVLLAWREVGDLFDRGVEHIDLGLSLPHVRRRATFTPRSHERLVERIRAPLRNRRTVEGRLLMADFQETGQRCRIHQAGGPVVQCTFTETHAELVRSLLRRRVRVTGEAEVDPHSQHVRRMAIADIEPIPELLGAEERDPFWEGYSAEELAQLQGVPPLARLEDAVVDFWPPELSADAVLELIRPEVVPSRPS